MICIILCPGNTNCRLKTSIRGLAKLLRSQYITIVINGGSPTYDTEAKKIVTDLRIKDKERKQFVQAEVLFTDTGTDTTRVQFKFEAHDEILFEPRPCSEIIEKLMREIKFKIGEGEVPQMFIKPEVPEPERKVPAPPWFLLGCSGMCVVFLVIDIIRELLK